MPPELRMDSTPHHDEDRLSKWTTIGAFACMVVLVAVGLMVLL